jgi:hypothetical protein
VESDGVTETLTHYAYDTLGRLTSVIVDFSPEDNSIESGETYTTSYTYDGDSHRVETITQSDGSSITFTYELMQGEYRIRTYTDAENRTTTLTYEQVSGGGGTGPVTANANTGVLSTTETQSTTNTHELNDSLLTPGDGGAQTIEHALQSNTLMPGAVDPWSSPEALLSNSAFLTDFNSAGDGIAIRHEDDANGNALSYVRFFDAASAAWSAETRIDDVSTIEYEHVADVTIDDQGNAAFVIVVDQPDDTGYLSAYTYDAATSTWSSGVPLTNPSSTSGWPTTSTVEMHGGRAVASWSQLDDSTGAVTYYAAAFTGFPRTKPFLRSTMREMHFSRGPITAPRRMRTTYTRTPSVIWPDMTPARRRGAAHRLSKTARSRWRFNRTPMAMPSGCRSRAVSSMRRHSMLPRIPGAR